MAEATLFLDSDLESKTMFKTKENKAIILLLR